MKLLSPVSTPYGKGFIQAESDTQYMVQINAKDMTHPTPSIIRNIDSHNKLVTESAGVIMWMDKAEVQEVTK